MGREIGGTKQSIGDITRDMLLEHLGEYYNAGQRGGERGQATCATRTSCARWGS